MTGPIWTRAAVLVVAERGSHHEHAGSFHLTADGGNVQMVMLKVLPEGRRAAEYGRSMLDHDTDGVRPAGLPGAQKVRFTTTNWAAELLWFAGKERHDGRPQIPAPMDLPVWVDPADGRVIEVHTDTLEQELLPLREEGVWLWKHTSSLMAEARAAAAAPGILARFGGSVLTEWKTAAKDLVADMKSRRPLGDRPAGAVEGVDYETWIQVKSLLYRDEVHPTHVDLFTHFRGVPWGRWAAIDASWSAHAPKEWVDYDFLRFRATGAQWEVGY